MYVCVALAVVVTPALLFAHARLVRSVPAANSRLSIAPSALELWFSERPERRFTRVELVDSAGSVVSLGAIVIGDTMRVTAPILAPLSAGRYSVAWRAAAADGHATSGRFSFVVIAAAASSPPPVTPAAAPDTVPASAGRRPNAVVQKGSESGYTTSVRWAELIAVITLIGSVVFRLFVLPRAEWPAAAVTDSAERVRRFAAAVLVLFAITTLTRLAAQSESMAGQAGMSAAAVLSIVGDTSWGRGWLFGVIGAAVVASGLLFARLGLTGWIVAALGAAAICLSEALTGHSGSMVRMAPLAIVTDVAHLVGAGGWLGGLACVAICGLPALRRFDDHVRDSGGSRMTRTYHRIAIESVVLVLVTALVAAWLRLNALSDLWTSQYGRNLLWKMALVLVLLIFGSYHWRTAVIPEWSATTGRRFRMSAAAELVVGALVIAVTAVLVSTELPS